ncbi:oxygenase MpaB family protein [Mycolicibacterium arseniciresistens]|uniref:Oxygenase MpaB family protein n=1 Tax=Mycolicibacterium arseniciresistens TaxID=3062257 RepID=A0ABT8UL70_9MYCO|nr:oxygenase MpaB family protein [Mycolicibacterium arseniciresistens]MDO3638553.1 oxygenase MpaB family protein [Mycolicibacterium arseniciresistens]
MTAHEDYGFFGPDSVTWKVWGYPTSLTVGFQRAVVVEELDPNLVAAVDTTHDIYKRPRTRYDRTLHYFALVAFGGTRETATASDILVKIHSKAIGTEPYGGGRYDANDPASQLWIHLTAWHSILYAYEKYGPGPLSPEEEARYWEECAIAAELQTCSPEDVPRTRDGVRRYFEQMRPQLAGSEIAVQAMNHLLDAKVMLPPMPRAARPVARVVAEVLRAGTIATMPQWMREMSDIRQPRIVDVAVRPVLWTAFRAMTVSPRAELAMLKVLSPMTHPVVAPVKLGVPPARRETLTPAEARTRYGFEPPAVAHRELRDRQAKRVFGQHIAPSDEGLIESEPILGSLS